MGVPDTIIAILTPVHLFAQFWYHTQHIGKMGFLEYIMVTPSQHRVHHAINKEYIDKNLGQVLCVWDRLFGTFQEELESIPPQYGVLKPASTWNPIIINFQHLWRLMKDAWRTRSFFDKLRIWFMPTGWRPADVKWKYLISIIEDVYQFEKYETEASSLLKVYAVFQVLFTTFLMMFMFYNYKVIGFDGLLFFGAFVFIGIYGYTSLMDRNPYVVWVEVVRGLSGIVVIWFTGDWFGINAYFDFGGALVALYFLITLVAGIYFTYLEKDTSSTKIIT